MRHLALFLAVLLIAAPASAAPRDIGKTTLAVALEGTLAGKRQPLKSGDAVYENHLVSTGAQGKAKFLFRDETSLTMGPMTRLILDRFVYDPDRGVGDVTIRSVAGMFRFISGGQRSDRYKITTSKGVIGVRGTVLEIYLLPDGNVAIVLVEGVGEICTIVCITLSTPGRFVLITSGSSPPTNAGPWRASLYNEGPIAAFTWVGKDAHVAIPDTSGPIDPRDIPGAIPLDRPGPPVSPAPSEPPGPGEG